MNKKEISEIKKLFTNERCCISRICGCYVDGNKNKITTFKDAFLSLPDEEIYKYFSIFRTSLSGSIGKNLMNMEFPLETEMEGGSQDFLMKLRDSHLKDDELLELFYNKIIDNYVYGENYLILLIDASYDVPGKSSDGLEMDDASDYVYEHILCSICPVNLSKEGLCYNAETNSFENRIRDWIVENPEHAFLFPAFNDRNTDIHNILYYSRNSETVQSDFIDGVLGCVTPMTYKNQKETFTEVITEVLGEECNFETVKNFQENLNSFIDVKKEQPDPVVLDKTDVRKLLETSGISNEQITEFDTHYDNTAGSTTSFMASTVASSKTFEVKTPQVIIKVDNDRTDLIETRQIDGKTYIMIEVTDQVEVNGITVKPL